MSGPGRAAGSVMLECPAGPSPIDVRLASGNPSVAWPDVIGITIPAGGMIGRFTVSAAHVGTATAVAVRATASGISKSAVLTVMP
jgi:hypothetical protein